MLALRMRYTSPAPSPSDTASILYVSFYQPAPFSFPASCLSLSQIASLISYKILSGQPGQYSVRKMAWGFVLAVAMWVIGVRYDRYRNPGIPLLLWSSTLLMLKDFKSPELPTDDIGYKIIAFSMVLWPGIMWAATAWTLALYAENSTTCLWLILSPLFVVLLGLPILRLLISSREPLRDWQMATGLATTGIIAGHFLSHSSLSQAVNNDLAILMSPFTDHPFGISLLGASMITYSTANMKTSRLRATQDVLLVEKLPTDTLILMNVPPSPDSWLSVLVWTLGLALCTSSMVHSEARAAFVAASVAVYLTMAVFPPFLGKVWIKYEHWMLSLLTLQVIVVNVFCSVYDKVVWT